MRGDIEHRALRASLTAWVDEHIAEIASDVEALKTADSISQSVDFLLIVAAEDIADPDSDTWYQLVSSGTSHYRKVGLAKVAMTILLRDDEDE